MASSFESVLMTAQIMAPGILSSNHEPVHSTPYAGREPALQPRLEESSDRFGVGRPPAGGKGGGQLDCLCPGYCVLVYSPQAFPYFESPQALNFSIAGWFWSAVARGS